jgi:hypothetical protein
MIFRDIESVSAHVACGDFSPSSAVFRLFSAEGGDQRHSNRKSYEVVGVAL